MQPSAPSPPSAPRCPWPHWQSPPWPCRQPGKAEIEGFHRRSIEDSSIISRISSIWCGLPPIQHVQAVLKGIFCRPLTFPRHLIQQTKPEACQLAIDVFLWGKRCWLHFNSVWYFLVLFLFLILTWLCEYPPTPGNQGERAWECQMGKKEVATTDEKRKNAISNAKW